MAAHQGTEGAGRYASRLPHSVPMGRPFQELFGPCRSTQSELIRKGELRSVLVGDVRGRRMIETQSWLEYVERQRQREAAGEIGMASPNPRARNEKAPAPSLLISTPLRTNKRARQSTR